jgi:hypothetical protein
MKSFCQFLEEQDIEALSKKYKVPKDQLRIGVKVEKEHDGPMGKDTDVVGSKEDVVKIAVAHLREDPKYYTKLKKIEDH